MAALLEAHSAALPPWQSQLDALAAAEHTAAAITSWSTIPGLALHLVCKAGRWADVKAIRLTCTPWRAAVDACVEHLQPRRFEACDAVPHGQSACCMLSSIVSTDMTGSQVHVTCAIRRAAHVLCTNCKLRNQSKQRKCRRCVN